MKTVKVGQSRELSRQGRRVLIAVALVAAMLPVGCASDGGPDERKGSPVQPGNSATIGADYSSLPKGKMYQPVPGTDAP